MDSTIRQNNERLRYLISKILSSGVGGKFTIGGAVHLFSMHGGGYIVGGVDEKFPFQIGDWRIESADIEEAVDHAIVRRTNDNVGLDF